jgi:hypothetical protein
MTCQYNQIWHEVINSILQLDDQRLSSLGTIKDLLSQSNSICFLQETLGLNVAYLKTELDHIL